MLDSEQCWQAVQDRDGTHDGRFFFGVLTTGVFCRPSCPSRTPLRKNVRFYRIPEDAEREGLRPCLRCRPLAVEVLCTTYDVQNQLPHKRSRADEGFVRST